MELLIVISIIGILIALLMPAVNAARESGRRAQCTNNLHELAKACVAFDTKQNMLPGGGWGWGWVGDPTRGVGFRQPGGWVYNILPHIDQQDLHDQLLDSQGKLVNKPLPITICPTRRAARAYPWGKNSVGTVNFTVSAGSPMGRSDYASNGGDKLTNPATLAIWQSPCGGDADCGPQKDSSSGSPPTDKTLAQIKTAVDRYGATGVDCPLGAISSASIKTGASYTYLLGEKSLDPNNYTSGQSAGDAENEYVGHSDDIVRWTMTKWNGTPLLPQLDKAGTNNNMSFGSAHAAGFNMAFFDGSVRKMNYNIDPTLHEQLSNRLGNGPNGPLTQLQKVEDASN